jgi:hypothetical protein
VDQDPSRGSEPHGADLAGLDNPGRVDLVRSGGSGPVELVLRAEGAWDGSDQRQILLQEKLNRYVEHVPDGELTAAHPEAAGRRWLVVIESPLPVDGRTAAYLRQADRELRRSGGGLELRQAPPPQ